MIRVMSYGRTGRIKATAHNYNGEVADAAIEEITRQFYPLMVAYYHKMNSLSKHTPMDLLHS